MKRRWSVLPVSAGALLLLVSCYPGEVTNIQQLDLVVTAHDDTVSFSSFSTYALLDSVVHIDLEDNANDSLLNRENDALILAEVRAGIESMGYIEEMDPLNTTPDAVFLVGAFAVEKSAYFSYGWWPYYGWGYPPGWGCCGPGYGWGYPATGKITYGVGTLAIIMMDPSRPSQGPETAPVLWVAGMNGLLGATSNAARISIAIDQAFDQSPYLNPAANLPN
jgi:hypothetical protein